MPFFLTFSHIVASTHNVYLSCGVIEKHLFQKIPLEGGLSQNTRGRPFRWLTLFYSKQTLLGMFSFSGKRYPAMKWYVMKYN